MSRPLALAVALLVALSPAARAQYVPFTDPNVDWHPDPGANVDEFGISVARSGEWAVVGAPDNTVPTTGPGAAYVYRLVSGTWQRFTKLTASDGVGGDAFGIDVAIDGHTIVVGARTHDHGQGPGAGAAYVFTWNGASWQQTVELLGTGVGGPMVTGFAYAVAISGDVIVVGSPSDERGLPTIHEYGAIHLYCRPLGGWGSTGSPLYETRRLQAATASHGAQLGDAVAIDGSVVIGGAFAETGVGAVYVFEEPLEGWCWSTAVVEESAKIIDPDGGLTDQFGLTVDVFEGGALPDRVVIGSWGHDRPLQPDGTGGDKCGAAYVVDEPAGGWSSASQPIQATLDLLHGQLTAGDSLGVEVAIDPTNPDRVVVGAPQDDPQPGTDWGRAFVFERQGGTWVNTHWLQTQETTAGGQFIVSTGYGLAIEGDSVLVGAPHDENASGPDAGAVFVFDLVDHDRRVYCFCAAAPCGNPDATGGCRNVAGGGTQLVPTGSTSVLADDLRFDAYGVVPNNAGIFFMGPAATPNPIHSGNGWRCVGPGGVGLFRYPVQFPTGTATPTIALGPGIVALSQMRFTPSGQIQAGQTWRFQAWYRDPNGACGAPFNFSNAIEIRFTTH